jgi:N-acetylglucosaminyldiphosphoundecaprenol N-acetyl-beta-D-mannosaminyltransferase
MTMTNTQTLKRPARIPKPLNIMGIPVVPFESCSQAIDCIASRIAARKKTFCVAINPEKIYRAQSDIELRELINAADIHICDGIGTVIGTRILHGRKIGRITGIQLFFDLVARAEKEGLKIFLLGASPESSKGTQGNLLVKYPNLKIVGCQDGYFNDDAAIVRMINDSGSDMLFVAMGSPKQELWIAEHKEAINGMFCMGVGGTFDVVSGRVKRAPKIFRKTGTEWFYRDIKQLRRFKRLWCLLLGLVLIILKRLRLLLIKKIRGTIR